VISEKTVELNLTAELLNWLYGATKATHFVIAPSQRAEARLGFDAGFYGSGPGLFIQFKRAYVSGSIWTWRLNRTVAEDQHFRLQTLQLLGVPVFYAFPYFATPSDVALWRMQLLTKTFWVKPLMLQPRGGPTGPHDLSFDSATGQWSLASPEPIHIQPPSSPLTELLSFFESESRPEELSRFVSLVNSVLFMGQLPRTADIPEEVARLEPDFSAAEGFALVGRAASAANP